MKTKTWNYGDSAMHHLMISQMANDIFGSLSNDKNPAHFSVGRMANTHFKKPIANGIQTLTCVGSAIVELFTTDNTMPIALEQHNTFIKPVFIGDTITAKVTVERNDDNSPLSKDEYWVQCIVKNQYSEIVLSATFRIRVLHA